MDPSHTSLVSLAKLRRTHSNSMQIEFVLVCSADDEDDMDLESMLNMIQQAGDDEEEEGDDEGLIMQGQEEDEEDEEGVPSIQAKHRISISIHSISWCVPPIRMETLCHPHLCDGLHCWIKAC